MASLFLRAILPHTETYLWEENLRLSFAVTKATPLPNSSIDAGSGTSSNWKVAVEKKNMGLPIESSPLK